MRQAPRRVFLPEMLVIGNLPASHIFFYFLNIFFLAAFCPTLMDSSTGISYLQNQIQHKT